MELQYWQSSLPVLLFTFFLLLVMLITTRKPATGDAPKRLPPGPKPLPIIGCIHHLLTGLPHRRLRDLARQYGPLMHLKLGQVSVVVVSSPQVATEVMKTHDLVFASRPEILAAKVLGYGCTDVVFAPYGEYWRQLRKICVVELLSARRVQSFGRVREEEVEGLVQSIRAAAGADQVVNLTEKLYALTSSIASRAAFGKKSLRHERFLAAMREAVKLASGFNIADLFPSLELVNVISGMKFRLEKVRRRLDGILDEIVEEHKMRKKINGTVADHVGVEEEDLLDVLLRIQESGDHDAFSLTTDNIKAVILDMFGAGTDTSAITMVWAMAELVRNPRVMRKVQAEVREAIHRSRKGEAAAAAAAGAAAGELSNIIQDMPYLRMVIQETLRLHPPLPLLVPRLCRERCEVGGFEIPANARVLVNAWAMARDPAGCWQPVDPEEFDPDRFRDMNPGFGGFVTGGGAGAGSSSMEYIPFGAGRRMCPGMQFAMATMELALARLLYCFNWEIPAAGGVIKPEELDMAEDMGATVTRKADLCLLASPYHVPSSSSSPSAAL